MQRRDFSDGPDAEGLGVGLHSVVQVDGRRDEAELLLEGGVGGGCNEVFVGGEGDPVDYEEEDIGVFELAAPIASLVSGLGCYCG